MAYCRHALITVVLSVAATSSPGATVTALLSTPLADVNTIQGIFPQAVVGDKGSQSLVSPLAQWHVSGIAPNG